MDKEEEENSNPTNPNLSPQNDTTSCRNVPPVETTIPTPEADMGSRDQILDSDLRQSPSPAQTETTVRDVCENPDSVGGDAVPFVDSKIADGDNYQLLQELTPGTETELQNQLLNSESQLAPSQVLAEATVPDVCGNLDSVASNDKSEIVGGSSDGNGDDSRSLPVLQPQEVDVERREDECVEKLENQEEVRNKDEENNDLIGIGGDAVLKDSDLDRKDVSNDDLNVEHGGRVMAEELDTDKELVASMGVNVGSTVDPVVSGVPGECDVGDQAGKSETNNVGVEENNEIDDERNMASTNDITEKAPLEELDAEKNDAVVDDLSVEAQTSGVDSVKNKMVMDDIEGKVQSSHIDDTAMDENAGEETEFLGTSGLEYSEVVGEIMGEAPTSGDGTVKNELEMNDIVEKVQSSDNDKVALDGKAGEGETSGGASLKNEENMGVSGAEALKQEVDNVRNEAVIDDLAEKANAVEDYSGNEEVMGGVMGEAHMGRPESMKEGTGMIWTGVARAKEDEELDNAEKMERLEASEETDLKNIAGNTGSTDGGEEEEEAVETEDNEMTDVAEAQASKEKMELAAVQNDVEMVETAGKADEAEPEDIQMEEELQRGEDEETEDASKSAGGKRKRGRASKAPAKVASKKKTEEDVCFICFDGGELVLCDRRGCPKAYHPSCVNRDEAFFKTKGRWNCGWHLCSMCEKNAQYMCLTCTFSLCKGCIKDADFFCVRGNKGFCEACMKTIALIESNEAQVNFDDKASWEYLFKDYWMDLKEKLSLTFEELAQASNSRKGPDRHSLNQESPDQAYEPNNNEGSGSDSSGNAEAASSKKRKPKKRLRSRAKERGSPNVATFYSNEGTDDTVDWASRELLEFVMHMKNGDKSVCSQFDVQALLLEYIKRNKLRDPRRKSQIICDARLQSLFGKPRVGHFEMLKLLESHFLLKEDSQDDHQGTVVDTEANLFEADGSSDSLARSNKEKKRKSRKKGDGRGLQSNVEDYAAIDMHNISLIYLKRSLMEALIENDETFEDKVVGAFVRIRISGSAQKQDLYRLVQVIGTNKTDKPYKVGKKMTDFLLEILNLNKTETVSIDIISNQEFTEDECKRLRQSIKCGLINRLTVGDVQTKALAFQTVRVEDTLEAEITRISHLRDRASDLGKRKELRECVEKLQILKSPAERQRRLDEYPEIHADPHMDPNYESEEDEDETEENYPKPRGSSFSRGRGQPISPKKLGYSSDDRSFSSMNRELSRNMSGKGFTSKMDIGVNDNVRSQGKDRDIMQVQSSLTLESRSIHSASKSELISKTTVDIMPNPSPVGVQQSATRVNETEKIWHYRDPSGKVQGPFSMTQLRKWSNTGYFPADLRIWRASEKQDDSILLTAVLNGEIQKIAPAAENSSLKSQMVQPHLSPMSSMNVRETWSPKTDITNNPRSQAAPSTLEVPKYSTDRWGSETNLPSPTPGQQSSFGKARQAYESTWSPTPAQQPTSTLRGTSSYAGGNEKLHSPTGSGKFSPTSKLSGRLVDTNMSHGSTPVPLGSANPLQIHTQPVVLGESPRLHSNPQAFLGPDAGGTSVNAINMKSLQHNSAVASHGRPAGSVLKPEMNSQHSHPVSGSQAWGSAPMQKPEPNSSVPLPAQPGIYGNWSGTQGPADGSGSGSSVAKGNPNGVSTMQGGSVMGSSDPWRAQGHVQSNIQPPVQPNAPWRMNAPNNQNVAPRPALESQNTSWGMNPGNPNMGWGSVLPANSNQGWVAPGQAQAPGNTKAAWVPPTQGQAPVNMNTGWAASSQRPPPANAFPNWASPAQGPAPANANQGWFAPNQGQLPGNSNSNWSAPVGNNRGGEPSRTPFRGQRICKFHESGHCKKGAQCDYLHN